MAIEPARPVGYEFGDVTVDVRARRIHRQGQPVHLEPKAWEVLLLFLENPDRVIEKQALLDAVWKEVTVTESALTRVIADLRQALGDDVKVPRYIETVHRIGYRFIGVRVTHLEEAEPAREPPAVAPDETPGTAVQAEPVATAIAQAGGPAAVPLERRWPSLPPWLGRLLERRGAMLIGVAAVSLSVLLLLSRSYSSITGFRTVETELRPQAVRLTTWSGVDSYPAMSADGRALAFSSDRTGAFELYVRQLIDGGRELQVTSDGQQNTQPAWSPDGQHLAYHSRLRGGIWLVPALGGAARQLATFGSRPAFTADGSRIAFQSEALVDLTESAASVSSTSTIWVVPVAGGAPRAVTNPNTPPGGHAAPAWSPDGTRLTFMASGAGGTSFWSTRLDDGRAPTRIECGDRACYDGVYSTDGLYFASTSRGPSTAIWRVPVEPNGLPAGAPVQVAASAGLPRYRHLSVTRDGARLSYALVSTIRNLWRVAMADPPAQPVALTSDASGYSMPQFSPDGSRLAFVSGRAGPHPEVWIANADGTSPRPLASGRPALFPSWFPDGRRVLTAVQGGRDVWLAWNVDGGEPSPMVLPPNVEHVRVSPDGRHIAYDTLIGGRRNVWVSALDGGAAVQITHEQAAEDPCWSPDGRWLAFEMKRQHGTQIGVAPSRGGRVDVLVSDPGENWVHTWSPDGHALAFAALREGVWNIWTVSLGAPAQGQITRNTRANAYMRYPAWSPDGTSIVYEGGETTGQIWLLHLNPSAVSRTSGG